MDSNKVLDKEGLYDYVLNMNNGETVIIERIDDKYRMTVTVVAEVEFK